MNGVGKPCAGEPHARFDRGPLGRFDAQVRWNTRTQRETGGTEPIRRTGYTEPAAYLTTPRERLSVAQRLTSLAHGVVQQHVSG
jgi:hypothetical protein